MYHLIAVLATVLTLQRKEMQCKENLELMSENNLLNLSSVLLQVINSSCKNVLVYSKHGSGPPTSRCPN